MKISIFKETVTAPEQWANKPNKMRQKDVDATWTQKGGQRHCAYKDHIKIDNKQKFIDTYCVTTAYTHDSQALETLLDKENDKGRDLYADSAYTGEKQDETISKYEVNNKVHERAYKNKPLTEEQKQKNTEK